MKFANVSSDAELTSLVRTQSETYADKLKTLASQFTDEVKANSDKFDGFFKTLADSITETANDLKTRNPELASFQVYNAIHMNGGDTKFILFFDFRRIQLKRASRAFCKNRKSYEL